MKKLINAIIAVICTALFFACGVACRNSKEDRPPYSDREVYLVAYAIFLYKTGADAAEEMGAPVTEYWTTPDSDWMPYAEPYVSDTGGAMLDYWTAFASLKLPYDPIVWAEVVEYTVFDGSKIGFMVIHSESGSVYELIPPVIFKDGEEFICAMI